jgi:hypothetical protein
MFVTTIEKSVLLVCALNEINPVYKLAPHLSATDKVLNSNNFGILWLSPYHFLTMPCHQAPLCAFVVRSLQNVVLIK